MEGPLAESPAEESGILPGQRVVEIDGYPSDLLTPLEIAALMRGPAGSSVDLTLADNKPHSKTWSLELERRSLPQPPMKVASYPEQWPQEEWEDATNVVIVHAVHFNTEMYAVSDAECQVACHGR